MQSTCFTRKKGQLSSSVNLLEKEMMLDEESELIWQELDTRS